MKYINSLYQFSPLIFYFQISIHTPSTSINYPNKYEVINIEDLYNAFAIKEDRKGCLVLQRLTINMYNSVFMRWQLSHEQQPLNIVVI